MINQIDDTPTSAQLRDDIRTELARVRAENEQLRDDIRTELARVRAENEQLRQALTDCIEVIEGFKDPDTLAEGVHTGLRKGTDAEDAHAIWSVIANSRSTAWNDAIAFAIDPYFTMWGGNKALKKAKKALNVD